MTRARLAYENAIEALHALARTLEADGQDNYALAARVDADNMHARKVCHLRKLETANDNSNGGSDATH